MPLKSGIFQLIMFLCLPPLFALQWPVDRAFLASSFLDDTGGRADPAMVFRNYDSLRPFEQGRVLYHSTPDSWTSLPPGGGDVLILEHENDFQSLYTDLPVLENLGETGVIKGNDSLCPGKEGLRYEVCRFAIRDAREDRLVNPLVLLPAVKDEQAPEFSSCLLVKGDETYKLEENLELQAGEYKVYIKARDYCGKKAFSLPYVYSLYNLGALVLENCLDTVYERAGALYLRNGSSLDSVFSRHSYFCPGEIGFIPGGVRLELALTDNGGNESSQIYNLKVKR